MADPTTDEDTYGTDMQGAVGYYGSLDDTNGNDLAWVKLGDPGADLSLNLSGYSDYGLFVGNDNQNTWGARLHLTAGGTEYVSSWESFATKTSKNLLLDFADALYPDGSSAGDITASLGSVSDIGLYIRGNLTGVTPFPSDPDVYHMSVVPAPAAVILGLLGLGTAGIKLRKYA